ncbi:MAG TPA: hypothetical protein VFH66_04875 [Mycobacteriales bacterium]|nr:hypothetical protein [Mycobacteriales bacterium]
MENLRRPDESGRHPMRLLAAGVPLSLLLDLASPTGPDSEDIAAMEQRSNAA